MVGLIVRLRFAMWRTAMSRSPLHLVSSIVGGLAALGGARRARPRAAPPRRAARCASPHSPCPLFAVITLMWAVLSLIATGVDSILDPARFAVLPLRARRAGAAGCSPPPAPASRRVMLAGLALAQAGSWLGHPPAVPAALRRRRCSGVLTAILLSRAVTSALAARHDDPGGRVLGAVVVVARDAPAAGPQPPAHDRARSPRTSRPSTPPAPRRWRRGRRSGWAWALPFDVATGRWGSAAVHLVARGAGSSSRSGRSGCASWSGRSPRR